MKKSKNKEDKIIIIGDGAVGSTFAYTLLRENVSASIGIIDLNQKKVSADIEDLNHTLPFTKFCGKRVYIANYSDVRDADLVVITANAPQAKFGEDKDRLGLLQQNVWMMTSITTEIMVNGFAGVILVVSNPVDALTQVVQRVSGLPTGQVIGTGTLLDTARLHELIADKLNVNPNDIKGFILGEHGNSGFINWSHLTIGSIPILTWLEKYSSLDSHHQLFEELADYVRKIGVDIFADKGNTSYGIASCLVMITEAILSENNRILPISAYLTGEYGVEGVYIGAPAILNRQGISQIIEIDLNDAELAAYQQSAETLKTNIVALEEKKLMPS
ncbi:L-lactate dehydrogenase [Pseudolactococcus yaeyamensis]